MARYNVHVSCEECPETHRTAIVVDLTDGPAGATTLGELYKGKALPLGIDDIQKNQFQCPKTGRSFTQKDNSRIFLIPSPD